jgi:hypothetical protein
MLGNFIDHFKLISKSKKASFVKVRNDDKILAKKWPSPNFFSFSFDFGLCGAMRWEESESASLSKRVEEV